MKRFLKLLRPVRGKILLFFLTLLLSTLGELALPLLMSMIVDNGIGGKDMNLIAIYCAVMSAVAVISFVSLFLAQKLSSSVLTDFTASLSDEVYSHTTHISLSDIGRIGTGALLTRSTSDIFMLQNILDMAIRCCVTVPVFIIGGSVLAFTKDVTLSLIIFLVSPLFIVATLFIGKKLEPLIDKSQLYTDKQNTIVRERLSGIRVIRAFNTEDKEHGRMKKATEVMADNIIRANLSMGLLTPLAMLLLNLMVVLILFISANRITADAALKVGDVVAIIQYVNLIMSAIFTSAFAIMMMPRARVCVKRINEIFSCPTVSTGQDETRLSGSVQAENLTFYYGEACSPALCDIDLSVSSGETAAIIGGTGSGKSTLLLLLGGFYPISSGTLRLGGRDMGELTPRNIAQNVSFAFQKSDIFAGTLRENLDADGRLSNEQIFEALEVAQFADFARENGLDYAINQAGSNLSGGQKQRLAITRALLHPASVYVFDDSFSALDYLTERKLRSKLKEYLDGKTVLISTQRVATARNCDRIFVLDGGKLIDSGKHEALMESCELYREIYQSQSGGEING